MKHRQRHDQRRAGPWVRVVFLVVAGLMSGACETHDALYCPDMSGGGGSAESSQCDREWSGCGYEREAVLMDQHRPLGNGFSSLRVSCDGDHCVCEHGQRTQRFEQARACEALQTNAKTLVQNGCGWNIEYLNTMDPEVQFFEDGFGRAGYCLAAVAIFTLAGLGSVVWWRRRKRAASTRDRSPTAPTSD